MRRFRALFLDRDGVINADIGYVSTKHRFMLKKEILPILRKAEMKGYKIIIISNQSGVGRGYFNERRNKLFNSWIKSYLYSKNISLTDMYFCFFHPESKISKYWQGDIDRKPNPGLFFKSAKDHKIDLNKSIMIGDKISDGLAARNAGIKRIFLLSDTIYKKSSAFSYYRYEDVLSTI